MKSKYQDITAIIIASFVVILVVIFCIIYKSFIALLLIPCAIFYALNRIKKTKKIDN